MPLVATNPHCTDTSKIVALILTLNEERHLERCISSISKVAAEIVVVDSFSSDATLAIARNCGARVIQHEWTNYATQFNWALTQLRKDSHWILRIDADEYLTPKLQDEISARLGGLNSAIDGVYCSRRMTFQGRMIRHGGVFPVRVLRLFRYGRGHCENRWMDEHVKVAGKTADFDGELIDDNLNSLTWWTSKHNGYASREAVDLLNLEYNFMPLESVADLRARQQTGVKRWLKEFIYARLPLGLRALGYFFYRYLIRLGFLDGPSGTAFHLLQGFWYRYLVDAKLAEVKRHMRMTGADVKSAIKEILGLTV